MRRLTVRVVPLCVLAALVCPTTGASQPPLRAHRAWAEAAEPVHLARRHALPRVYLGPSRRAVLGTRLRGAEAAVLRILAIRVDFPPPRPEDGCGVSGNGTFDLSGEDLSDRYPGAPPHNKRYFEGLMEALRRYYGVQSHGELAIEYRVIPDGPNDAYRMPNRTAYYSSYRDPNDLHEREDRLARLAADALRAADGDTSVTLGEFDTYIVFHAGGDWQHDWAGDSPCDLITAYIPSLARFLGDPVLVDDGTHAVDDVIVMPEAINQDLDPSREIACLHSELAHEFGHQLGLMDLYDYSYFSNVVGYWALMDNGDGMAFQDQSGRILVGVLPPSLCAFSKQMLGWAAPEELTVPGDYSVTASTLAPSAYRVTLSDTEYFLLENRQVDTDGDPTVYLKSEHGAILGPASASGDTTTDEYDAGLPGSGLLVWHVDTKVGLWELGLPNYLEYDAQADTLIRHRGVALEEADGIENIGLQYFETRNQPPGTVSVDPGGTEGDPFRAGHNDRFGDATRPASWDNSARRTHVEISQISSAGPIMTFSYQRTWAQGGWPVAVAPGPLTSPVAEHTSGGEAVIVTAGRGRAFSIGADHLPRPLWDSRQAVVHAPALAPVADEREFLVALGAQGGRLAIFPLRGTDAGLPLPGWPTTPTGRALSTPVLADLDGDGAVEVAVGSDDGKACLLAQDGAMRSGWPHVLGDGPVGAPAVADLDGDGENDIVFCGEGVHAFRTDGTPLPGWPVLSDHVGFFEPLLADLEGDSRVEVIVATPQGVWVVDRDGEPVAGWPVTPGRALVPPLMIIDADGDSMLDVVAADSIGGIWAWSAGGSPLADCAGAAPASSAGRVASLLGFDADGDGFGEFVVVGGRQADLRRPSGRSLPGWPLAVTSLTGGAMADLDRDGDLEIILSDSLGSLHVWDLPYGSTRGWFAPRADAAQTGWAGRGSPPASDGSPVEVRDFYVWPSPVRGADVHVSFRVQPGALVGLTVMDAAGRVREEWSGTATGQRQDWTWPVHLPMGVYFCRLQARLGGSSQTLIHRFAVAGE